MWNCFTGLFFFLIKKSSRSIIKNENISNQELAEEVGKPLIKKFNEGDVNSPFVGNIWGADLADLQLISKFDKEFRYL